MEQTLTLTAAELVDLTHKQRPTAQHRALNAMGIEHRLRPDGSVAVLRISVLDSFGVKPARSAKRAEINWDAMPNARREPDWAALLKADELRLREKRKRDYARKHPPLHRPSTKSRD